MVKAIRGMRDILPQEVGVWRYVEEVARRVFELYGFSEIRVPILERTELFSRSLGESSDIVEKEMYTFLDRKGESVTLRPEATACVLRAYIEHHLHAVRGIQKLYCIGPMFRYERPQRGRYRQFHQINAEVLGSDDPGTDAELLALLRAFFEGVGLEGLDFQVNSLGCRECRLGFRDELISYLKGMREALCEDCQRRLEVNPLRAFDCKAEGCRRVMEDAPKVLDFLCEPCRNHFQGFRDYLELLKVDYTVNPRIVRGLDYYIRTTFEVISMDLGAQNAVCGGGRYDGLIKELGGPDLPGIGFAIGEERLVTLLMDKGIRKEERLDLFIAALGEGARREAFKMVEMARRVGLRAEMDLRERGLKAQMRHADKLGAKYTLILGDDELSTRRMPLRSMDTGIQEMVDMEGLEETFRRLVAEDGGDEGV